MPIGRKKKISEFGLSEPNRRVVPAYFRNASATGPHVGLPYAKKMA